VLGTLGVLGIRHFVFSSGLEPVRSNNRRVLFRAQPAWQGF
jgi:hypothetical protein